MQVIKTTFFLVSKKINFKDYPIIAFDTEAKAIEYMGEYTKENGYILDEIDVEYDLN